MYRFRLISGLENTANKRGAAVASFQFESDTKAASRSDGLPDLSRLATVFKAFGSFNDGNTGINFSVCAPF